MLKLSFRALWAKRSFSLLNILGLAVGIAASLLIYMVIRNERSYDTYQSKKDRIYRVVTTVHNISNGEVVGHHVMALGPLANSLRQDFPEIEKVAATENIWGSQIYVPGKGSADEKRFKEDNGQMFVEPALFDMLDFTWLAGNAKEMNQPNTAVLNETRAKAYFGDVNSAIGKTIQIWSFRIPLRIVGVFKDLPANTDILFQLAASYQTMVNLDNNRERIENDWSSLSGGSQCFVMLSSRQDPQKLQARLPDFVTRHFREKENHSYTRSELLLQPLPRMHLDATYELPYSQRLSPNELWALGLVGIFLLLVACINFINLSTAQSVSRAKEIGVRKVLGSNRIQLLSQFMVETALITFFALILGTLMAVIATPFLSQLMDKHLVFDIFKVSGFLLVIGVVVTIMAGFYPAIVMSGFNPVVAIKSRINTNTAGGISLRRGLVVFQFVIAQLLVIGTLVVLKQMQYFQQTSLGFQREAIMVIDLPSDSTLKTKYHYLKSQLMAVPGVLDASLINGLPSRRSGYYSHFYYDNRPNQERDNVKRLIGDSSYCSTFGLQLKAGRYAFPSDSLREALVNEAFVKQRGISDPNEILGKTISFDGQKQVPIVGVLKDFHNNPLNEAISPIVYTSEYPFYGSIAVRMQPEKVLRAMDVIKRTFSQIYPTYLYDYTFYDKMIGQFYQSEAMIAELFKLFAFLAIFISCLGLYGLVSFMAVQKTKEVGIRKVLGASVQHIVYLFSKEFTVLIGIAFVLAAPVGYYFMSKWLSGYYYHTRIGVGVFVGAVFLSIVIAWVTVGYKAVKAALVNPVKSLRSE